MTNNLSWNLFYLRDNPFLITPPGNPAEIIWAGMPDLKRELDLKFREAKQSAATQVILNRGPFGGGKTHALQYYSIQTNWPDAEQSVKDVTIISVSTPKQTGKPYDDFYTDVLERIGMSNIRQRVTAAVQAVGVDIARQKLIEVTKSDSLGRAILLLAQNNPVNGNPTLFDSGDYALLVDTYFLSGCTKTDLRKLGLARNIEKAQDKFRILSGILHCLIGLQPSRELASHSRVVLWLDEMEDFVYFTATQYRPFTQGLRDMIDNLPAFFTLLLNFTMTDPEELDTIELVMGKALVDRVTSHTIFREMKPEQSIQYVREILQNSRTDGFNEIETLYPFADENTLKYIVSGLEKRTPRSLNKRCGSIATTALQRLVEQNSRPGQIKIDTEFVKTLSRSEIDDELD